MLRSTRDTARQVIAFHPAPGSWVAASQAAVAVTLFPALFALFGQLQLGLLASFGALIILYSSDRSRRERALKLPVYGAGFLAGAVVGVVAGGSLAARFLALGGAAIAFSFLTITLRIGPPGAVFPVLVTGATGQLTAAPSVGGLGLDPLVVLGMVALGTAAGYIVTVAPLLVPGVRARDAARPFQPGWSFSFPPDSQRIFWRLVAAILLSVVISAGLGLHHSAWVLIAAISVLQKDADVRGGAVRITQRLVGTLLGAGLAMPLHLVTPGGLALVATVGLLVFGYVVLLRRNFMLALMCVTPMALLIVAGGNPDDFGAFTEIRVTDTIVGAVVAAGVLLAVVLRRQKVLEH